MKGLEISEGLFSETIKNKDFRIDSQYYTQAPIKNQKLKYKKIGEIIHSSQYGLSIEMNEDMCGYPIYRMNELHDMLCDLEVNKFADIPQEEYQRFALKNRDVLFNRTNSFEWVGRTGIYYQNDNIERTFASYLVRFNPKENIILPEYLCAFLNSKRGAKDIKRRARQSINQTNVNPEEVKEIEIPILNMDFQLKIKEYFEKANLYRLKSLTLYKNAENQLLEELGLKDWQPNNDNVSIKSFSDFNKTGRLDAEYYQNKYDELFGLLRKNETNKLGKIVNIKKSIEPGSDAYKSVGIPFIRVSNVSKFGLSQTDIFLDQKEYFSEDLMPKKDTILFSKDGSIGIAYKVEKDIEAITSGALLHLKIKDERYLPDYLTLVLNSVVVRLQSERDAGGSIIQHWKPSEIEEVIIPRLPMEIQHQISSKIQESFALQSESKRLLEEAKMLVEREIEK